MARKARQLDVPPEIHGWPSAKVMEHVARLSGGRMVMSFSCGKDSVGAVLAARDYFPQMELVFLYYVPDLRIQEEALAYYEGLWGKRIHRLPFPATWLWLRNRVHQTFIRNVALRARVIPKFEYSDLVAWLLDDLGWPPNTPQGVGVRTVDSIFRSAALRHVGGYNRRRNIVYPIYDWSQDQLLAKLDATGTKLPADYHIFGRSFPGIDFRSIAPLAEHYPDDWQRVLAYFPTLKAELLRYEFAELREQRNRWRKV